MTLNRLYKTATIQNLMYKYNINLNLLKTKIN